MGKVLLILLLFLLIFNNLSLFCRARPPNREATATELHSLLNYVRSALPKNDERTVRTITFKIENIVGNCGGPCSEAGRFRQGISEFVKFLKREIPDHSVLRTITFNIVNIVGNCSCKDDHQTGNMVAESELKTI